MAAFAPVSLSKNGKTVVATTAIEVAQLLWNGWRPNGSAPPFGDQFDDDLAERLANASSKAGAALGTALEASAAVGRDPGLNLGAHALVLARGAVGAWDANAVESLVPFWDHTSGRWAGVYPGYGTQFSDSQERPSVGLAFSDDLVTWTKTGGPVFGRTGVSGDPDAEGTTGPVVVYDAGTWYLFYIGTTAAGYEQGEKALCLATTTAAPATWTPASWTRRGAIISKAGTGWRAKAVWHPSVVKRGSTWYLFFNATGADDIERIGYATAPTLTGPWTVDDAHSPLISPSASGWDSFIVGDPSVYRVGDGWLMSYFGVDQASNRACDGVAHTTDAAFPLGWTKRADPILQPGPAGTFDERYAHKPVVIHSGGVAHHFYTAVDSRSSRQVGLAVTASSTNPAPAVPLVSDAFDRADSTTTLGSASTGQLWTPNGGTWGIDNGRAYSVSGGGFALIDAGQPVGRIDVRLAEVAPTAGQAVGLMLRYFSADVHYELDVKGGGQGVELDQFNFGASAVALDPGAWLSGGDLLTVLDDGTQIVVLKNGTPVVRYVTTVATRATQFGIKVYGTAVPRFESFVAYGRDAVGVL